MNTAPRFAYVGSRTTRARQARGEGISVFRYGAEGGTLERIQVVAGLENPSFLTLNAARDRLYTVHGDGHHVSVFSVDAHTGTLALRQEQDCGGRNPVHLALSPHEDFLVVSDHLGQGGGTLAVLPVAADGRLGPVCQRVALPGEPGPHRQEQPHAKPHFNPFDPSGRWVLVPDKGLDRVFVFRFENGCLQPAATPWLQLREGSGPRHLAFHPTRPFAYVLGELDSTVVACRFDAQSGALHAHQVLPALPDSFTGFSRAAEIEVAPGGRHVYASHRGHDSIALFELDEASGRLRFIEAVASGGATPRFFCLAPGGHYLFALNEDSDSIVRFRVDAATGRLTALGAQPCASAVCLVFA